MTAKSWRDKVMEAVKFDDDLLTPEQIAIVRDKFFVGLTEMCPSKIFLNAPSSTSADCCGNCGRCWDSHATDTEGE